jgi:hypothetical protein
MRQIGSVRWTAREGEWHFGGEARARERAYRQHGGAGA